MYGAGIRGANQNGIGRRGRGRSGSGGGRNDGDRSSYGCCGSGSNKDFAKQRYNTSYACNVI